MWRWFETYFIKPAIEGSYNIVNTPVYALLIALCVYPYYKLVKRFKLKIDWRFGLAVLPYVILSSSMRVLEDAEIVSGYLFITPFIWILNLVVILIPLLFLSLKIQEKKGIPYFKPVFIIGLFGMGIVFGLFNKPVNFLGAALILAYFSPWIILFIVMKFWNLTNRIVSLVQMFDATTTFVGINYFGYVEKHVVPNLLINVFGPFSFVLLKFVVVVSALLVIDRFSENVEFNNFIKLCIGVLGVATGTRDFLRLLFLV